jgi:hypothetical protein
MAQKEKSFLESIADMGSQILAPKKPKKPKLKNQPQNDEEDNTEKFRKSVVDATGGE